MKKMVIISSFYSDETAGTMLWTSRDVRKALKRCHEIRAIITTTDGNKLKTSPIVAIKKNKIRTENSLYVQIS